MPVNAGEPQAEFMRNLVNLCGARYEGEMTFPPDGQDSFKGKRLVAELENCTDEEVKIPFVVGEDQSRTWIISQTKAGLELKHDHRHADGTPDEVTMYGGLTVEEGSGRQQSFPADIYTQELIPDAATNVWSLRLSDDNTTLTYHLQRHNKDRFIAVLKRVKSSK